MKRLIVLMIAAVMMLGTAAYASPSIPGNDTRVVPAPTPARPAAAQQAQQPQIAAKVEKITDAAAVVESLLKEGKTLAIDAETLEAVIKSVNDPAEETMPVAEAVEALTKGTNAIKAFSSDGKEDTAAVIELDILHFVSAFEKLSFDKPQQKDAKGKPIPVKVTLAPQCLADVKAEDVSDYMMMIFDPTTGELAFIQLTEKDLDTTKNPAQLTVSVPFEGIFTFVQKEAE